MISPHAQPEKASEGRMKPGMLVGQLQIRTAILALLLVASASGAAVAQKALAPVPSATLALMAARDTSSSAPILLRAFKKESELEVWKKTRQGRYVLLKTFPICRWSGQLGPKKRQGDRQAPEGFYAVGPRQMNPNSAYYLSFDMGFPNAYDRAQGASGSALMVHGACSSAGCFAMTNKQVAELYAIARDALAGGQSAFQMQSFPFRMTAEAMARHRTDPNLDFWRQLKEGSDRFEATGQEVAWTVAAGRYAFKPLPEAEQEARARARLADEQARMAALIADGIAAVRTTYSDGGQHPAFRSLTADLGEVSRPEALAYAGREIVLIAARKKPTLLAGIPLPPERPTESGSGETDGLRYPAPLPAEDLFAASPMRTAASVPTPIQGSPRILSTTAIVAFARSLDGTEF
jgi:murein L,D-transpeptidase YafK